MSTARPALTLRQAILLYEALPVLDGHVESVTTENTETNEKVTVTKVIPYVFGIEGKGGGKVRWNITKNMSLLKREYDAFVQKRDNLIVQLSGGSTSIPKDDIEAIDKLHKETQLILDEETKLPGLLKISLGDLNLEDNPNLTPSALTPLMALIKE